MTVMRVAPDDLALAGARAADDHTQLDEAARHTALAGQQAIAGVGDSHGGLVTAVLDFTTLHRTALTVLGLSSQVLAGGLARAAQLYEDVDAHAAASLRRSG